MLIQNSEQAGAGRDDTGPPASEPGQPHGKLHVTLPRVAKSPSCPFLSNLDRERDDEEKNRGGKAREKKISRSSSSVPLLDSPRGIRPQIYRSALPSPPIRGSIRARVRFAPGFRSGLRLVRGGAGGGDERRRGQPPATAAEAPAAAAAAGAPDAAGTAAAAAVPVRRPRGSGSGRHDPGRPPGSSLLDLLLCVRIGRHYCTPICLLSREIVFFALRIFLRLPPRFTVHSWWLAVAEVMAA